MLKKAHDFATIAKKLLASNVAIQLFLYPNNASLHRKPQRL